MVKFQYLPVPVDRLDEKKSGFLLRNKTISLNVCIDIRDVFSIKASSVYVTLLFRSVGLYSVRWRLEQRCGSTTFWRQSGSGSLIWCRSRDPDHPTPRFTGTQYTCYRYIHRSASSAPIFFTIQLPFHNSWEKKFFDNNSEKKIYGNCLGCKM